MSAYGPLFMTMGGKRAPPPTRGPCRGQSLSGGGGCNFRARAAVPFRWAHQASDSVVPRSYLGGGGAPCVASSFSPRCWGPWGGWAYGLCAAPPPPPGWSLPQVDWVLACPPPPGCVGWPAARAVVCVVVCKVHRLPSGGRCDPCFSSAVLPGASQHTSGQGEFPCRSQTQDFVKRLLVSFFRAAIRATCGVKVGIMGRPSPTYSTSLPSG